MPDRRRRAYTALLSVLTLVVLGLSWATASSLNTSADAPWTSAPGPVRWWDRTVVVTVPIPVTVTPTPTYEPPPDWQTRIAGWDLTSTAVALWTPTPEPTATPHDFLRPETGA